MTRHPSFSAKFKNGWTLHVTSQPTTVLCAEKEIYISPEWFYEWFETRFGTGELMELVAYVDRVKPHEGDQI